MFYHLFYPLADKITFFNLFQYLTFRSGGAVVTSMLICFLLGPRIINWLRLKQGKGQPIREDGPEGHLVKKKGTPTMGGLMMLLAVIASTLLWVQLDNPYIWIVLMVLVGYGLLGFLDDYLKVTKQSSYKGLTSRQKLLGQFAIAAVAVLLTQQLAGPHYATHVAIPFLKDILLDLGILYTIFGMLVVVGASNAVNLTDGLDGLASVPIMLAAGCFGLIAWLSGNAVFSEYLQIHFVQGAGELAIICGALVGACLGFLWFNAPPAKVFMGDTGSLAFGGLLGIIAVVVKHEIVLAIIGGVFVMEAVSVMLQVGSYKLTGKRIFLMAPIHHHFEKKGWEEPTIVIRFWIIAAILALAGLATLKVR